MGHLLKKINLLIYNPYGQERNIKYSKQCFY